MKCGNLANAIDARCALQIINRICTEATARIFLTLIRRTMDERDYKAMNKELNPPLRQTAVSSSARYIIVNSSVSAHCCFGYTIIDTAAGKESYGDYWKRSMCETFEEEEAKIICDALNKHCC